MDSKPFAMFFNASPRKGWNTHKMLEAAKAGAEGAGAATELVNLYDIKFPGCKSCFACKLKNAKTNGVCAIRDDLRPILERARQAKKHGFGVLQFNAVVEGNIHARHLYERLGFTQLGTIPRGFRMKDGSFANICPYYKELV